MNSNNINDKIKELLGETPDKFSVIEQQIPIEVQMSYFELSKQFKGKYLLEDLIEFIELLDSESISTNTKKELLAKIASIELPEAYRAIEKFGKTSKSKDLKNWAVLALFENRMLLESTILGQKQVIVSSGLGGKDGKLRYFIVIFLKDELEFDDTHLKVINNEFSALFGKNFCVLEKIKFFKNYFTIQVLIPLKVEIPPLFSEAVRECNQFGNFLKSNFIITNVKKLTSKEINNFKKRHKK